MAESIDRYFRMVTLARKSRPAPARLWRPAADVYQTSNGWIVKFDLAGVAVDDLEIEIQDQTLRIAGCRRDALYGEGVSYRQLEITYSRFERTLDFPCSIDDAHLVRDYRDGLLILHLRSVENCEETMNAE